MKYQKDLLGLYLDNRLEEWEERRLEEHLRCCPICHGEMVELKNLFAWLRPIDDPAPGNDFAAGLLAAVDKELPPLEFEIRRRQRIARYLGTGAVFLGLGGVALLVALLWSRLSPALWSGLVLLWGKIGLLAPDALLAGIDGLMAKGRGLSPVIEAITDDSYLWATLTAAGFFGWIMTKEIIEDVQRLIGYKNR